MIFLYKPIRSGKKTTFNIRGFGIVHAIKEGDYYRIAIPSEFAHYAITLYGFSKKSKGGYIEAVKKPSFAKVKSIPAPKEKSKPKAAKKKPVKSTEEKKKSAEEKKTSKSK